MTRIKRKKAKLTLEEVEKELNKHGCKLLIKEYVNSEADLTIMCRCGETFYKSLKYFRRSPRCKECIAKRKKDNVINLAENARLKSFQEAKVFFSDNDCFLYDQEYTDVRAPLKFLCKCGREDESSLRRFKKRKECYACTKDRKLHSHVYTIGEIDTIFKDNNCILLTREYFRNKQPLDFECYCGRTSSKNINEFLESPKCSNCGNSNKSKNKKLDILEVKALYESEDCELLEDIYHNNSTQMKYMCSCGGVSFSTLDNFQSKVHNCLRCYELDRLVYSIENTKLIVEEEGFTYLHQDIEHRDARVYFICSCGRDGNAKVRSVMLGAKCLECYKENHREKTSGDKNSNWNPYLTDEDRQDSRLFLEYIDWRKDVYARDHYTCQCCGQLRGSINAHHKDSYHWCKERRTDASNGVTLCEDCHVSGEYAFHRLYGNKYNTEEQYDEWIETYQSIIVSSKERRIS